MNGIIDAAADFPLPNAIVDDTANVTDIFRDLFENKTMAKEDEKFLNDLIFKIADAKNPQIIPYVKYIPVKTEEPKPKFDDVVIIKDPEIDESLPDLDAYDAWLQKQLKTETFPDVKPKTETIFPDIKPKTEIFLPDMKPKTEIFLPDIKPKTDIFS